MSAPAGYVTVREIAALLGMTPSGVRDVISRKRIKSVGKGDYGAKLYDAVEILREAGSHHRRLSAPDRDD